MALSSKKNKVFALHDIVLVVLSSNEVEEVGPSSYGIMTLPSRANEVKSPSIKNKVRIPHDVNIRGSSSSEEESDYSSSRDVAAFLDNEETVGPSSYGVKLALASKGDEVRLSAVCGKPSNQASMPLERMHTENTVGCTYIVDEKILGSGGFGTVRRCTRKGTEERFAIKTMRLKREGQLEECRYEAHVHQQCSSGHPNVVNFVDKFESGSIKSAHGDGVV